MAKNSKEIKNLSASKIIPKIVNKKAIAIPVRQIGQNDKSARPKSINKIAHSNAPKKHKNRKQVPPI